MVMMIEAKYRLARGPKHNGETQNGFRLLPIGQDSVKVTGYSAVEIMIALYQAQEYNRALGIVENTPTAHEFSSFLAILTTFRLLQRSDLSSDVRRRYAKVLSESIQEYRRYHFRENGPKSTQYAYAALLAHFCLPAAVPATGQDKERIIGSATKYLPDSERLFSLIRGNRYFDAGNYDEALSFYRTLPLCYYNQVLPRLVSKKLWHHAFGFAFLLCKNYPCEANATQFAICCYALGMKSYAIRYMGYENRAIMKTWPKSEWRVCEECWQPGHAKDMVCCTCKESWYCNSACCAAFSMWHPCRICAFCLVSIRDKHPWRCLQCYLRIYCSAECQSRDWYEKDHRGRCK
jgi:hypothetical protein